MTRRYPLVIAFVAIAMFGGCARSNKSPETGATVTQPSPTTPRDTSTTDPANAAAPAEGDALLRENDRAIADNKRMIKLLARYQREDFPKYDRLRQQCEAQAHGTLADSAAPVIARCMERSW